MSIVGEVVNTVGVVVVVLCNNTRWCVPPRDLWSNTIPTSKRTQTTQNGNYLDGNIMIEMPYNSGTVWLLPVTLLERSLAAALVAVSAVVVFLVRRRIRACGQKSPSRRPALDHSLREFSNLDMSEHSLPRSWGFSNAISSLRPSITDRRSNNFDFSFLSPSDGQAARGSQGRAGYSSQDRVDTPRVAVASCKYYGPWLHHFEYEAFTPPPPWLDKARQLLPSPVPTLRRILKIQIANDPVFSVITPSQPGMETQTEYSVATSRISIHPQAPVTGGVLQIYQKDSPQSEWKEYTFATPRDAAQFQLDLQCLQTFGNEIFNMYQALEIIHRGSMACLGSENILHDTFSSEDHATRSEQRISGIAWDDVMRSLGVHFRLIRLRLEQLWWSKTTGGETPLPVGLKEEYRNKRMVIGLIDFIRIFVPRLPAAAIPEILSSNERFERALRWRKRVARSSVLVRGYVAARVVVNNGWKLNVPLPDAYWTRRMAYDDTVDNMAHDSGAENEVYEPTISRDIQCIVRSKREDFTQSNVQAFTLVDAHLLRATESGKPVPFDFTRDPVKTLPTLGHLVKKNASSEFFILTFKVHENVVLVYVFVRSLPCGVDAAFDRTWSALWRADAATRSQKLECVIGISTREGRMPMTARIAWHALSLGLRQIGGIHYISQRRAVSADHYPLGSCALSLLGELRHFGGSNGDDVKSQKNYLATNVLVDSKYWIRTLFDFVIRSKEILTFTVKMKGEDNSELPERALAVVRNVRISSQAQPVDFSPSEATVPSDIGQVSPVWWQGILIGEFSDDAVSSITSIAYDRPILTTPIATSDPIEKKINQVIELLEDVRVPSRGNRTRLLDDDLSRSADLRCPPSAEMALGGRPDLDQVAVLSIVSRKDIRRHCTFCGMNVKATACSVTDTAAWRGLTFPVDIRRCRVELQNGQCFQQGIDLSGHPVFYFLAMCRGRWRGDEDALISCVLHRLDTALQRFVALNPDTRCTLVVLLGKPVESRSGRNTRISAAEPWQYHVNTELLYRLFDILLRHYPERLHRALLVTQGSKICLTAKGSPTISLPQSYRSRVRFLRRYDMLSDFVHANELVDAAGGLAPVEDSAFNSF
jgi:hypothetical protein